MWGNTGTEQKPEPGEAELLTTLKGRRGSGAGT